MAYTATNWVEGVTTLGPTNMNKIETELVYLDTRIPVAALGYGTSLPGSPVDGQEYVLVDGTTPSYQWRFRYNAGSTSAYKWEFVGGPAAIVDVLTDEGTASTTYTNLATTGPQFTLPRAGDYRAEFDAESYSSTSAVLNVVAVQVGAAATADGDGSVGYIASASNTFCHVRDIAIRGAAASAVVALRYRVSGGTGNFRKRELRVTPIRVS